MIVQKFENFNLPFKMYGTDKMEEEIKTPWAIKINDKFINYTNENEALTAWTYYVEQERSKVEFQFELYKDGNCIVRSNNPSSIQRKMNLYT